ncbi:PREDICTED: uncharacterized protein LOC108560565 [Nicrophorus vespilloides]|uniref:Uncharacterized protein LOC108560565 n=1 Tax=Nicrophorus vespilloides TaxID=110193 RepID=A0ABM1MGG0_NICVS|nr:PREDICTED: uncharacterized protein LOC108560565 [Nicrophorus vespilloides]XP_017773661.1 PREDICTED: uncharacterized protein LOC108560565 [Nicrophorus vespilloides]XP_017773662.1 PREDICTED: uncharacterized protein LOC108560565 [Nicrophorus vespilloides]XP_017773664.1 PREDICTED: uncharacterized protein LOC108560565 [Nicrophorus vespilloides]XP_017773665.1 PREDICTED: uncharacterized protein LOC108560565 [Nicrophorus vespilloides]
MAKRGHYSRWSENDLLMAIAAYKDGESGLNECSRKFGVPKATIKRHADRNNQVKALGRQATFSSHMEKVLSSHILQLEKCSFGLTTNEIRKLAFDVAEKHSLPHTFNKEKKIAGKKWFYAFMRRNPQLSRIKTGTLETTFSDSESSSNDLVDNALQEKKNTQFKNVFDITEKNPGPSDFSELTKKPSLEDNVPSCNKKITSYKKTQNVDIVKVEENVSDEFSVKQESSELGCLKRKSEIEETENVLLLKINKVEDEIKIKLEIDEDVDECDRMGDGFEFVDVRMNADDRNEHFDIVNPIS